jgi:prepilin-type N-terminal cleavage/methylation domain-containing protein
MKNARRNAFTLIEVLIVVIIMAVLAATIIPQFSSSTKDAKDSSLKFNLHTVRSQIEMYKTQHNGKLPTFANFKVQMTEKSDVNGTKTGELVCGPYIQGDLPYNPFNNSNAIVAVASEGTVPTAVVSGGAGWQYDQSTGGFYPNNSEYFATTGP